jgi:hypothetical protein
LSKKANIQGGSGGIFTPSNDWGELATIFKCHLSPAQSGKGEIRTPDTLSSMPPFQGGALDHYATFPL